MKAWKPKRKKRNENLNPPEGFSITFWIPEGNSTLAQAKKEIAKKKPKKIGFYSTSWNEEKRKKKTEEKVGFYYINLYFRGIVSIRKKK